MRPAHTQLRVTAAALLRPACEQLIEDVLLWMGWPDTALSYHSHSAEAGEKDHTLTVRAVLAPCEGLEGAFGPATPQRLGAVVLEEALSGKLTPGLEPSKAFHDLS